MLRSLVLAVMLTACGHHTCIRKSDCPPAETCTVNGVCAGAPDAGATASDAADVDADVDAGLEDAN